MKLKNLFKLIKDIIFALLTIPKSFWIIICHRSNFILESFFVVYFVPFQFFVCLYLVVFLIPFQGQRLRYPKGLTHFIFTKPHLNMLLKLNDTFILKV
jgi:hypothetical protein